MKNLAMIWFIALSEIRVGRRLLRTWFVIALAFAHAGYHYWDLSSLHATASSFSASAGLLSPKYMLGASFALLLLILQIGIVLLVFDTRARDARARIDEAFSARPFTNLELLTGRLLGVTLLMAIPAAALVVLLAITGLLLHLFQAPLGESLEPYSVLSFMLLDLVPNLACWCAITMVAILLIRSGLFAAALSIALAVAFFVTNSLIPYYLLPAVANTTSAVIIPSELAPEFANGWVVSQRLMMIFATIGLLFVGSLLHPRQDDSSRSVRSAVGLGCLFVAVGVQTLLILNAVAARTEFDRIASAHKSNSMQPRVDVEHIEGKLIIDPGDRLDVEYQIFFLCPADIGDELLFAFNPGFKIESLVLNSEVVPYVHSDGLLSIPIDSANNNTSMELVLSASGNLDTSFGYLDAALNEYSLSGPEGRALSVLGVSKAISNSEYVALTPAVKWYPTAGPAYGEDDLEIRPRDQFTINIDVVVPDEWTVAGPGSRENLSDDEETRFRFSPQASLPEVGLFAARFVRYATTIAGVEFELLLNSKHTRNIAAFVDAMPSLQERVADIVNNARTLGLDYPYGTLSFVEVPSYLRVYGGGWRMDTRHVTPGVQLIRESGFPTARFDDRIKASQLAVRDWMSSAEVLTAILDVYFESDVSGGNPFMTASRNLMSFQASPTGEGATSLGYLVDSLVSRIVRSPTGFYSIYYAADIPNMLGIARLSSYMPVYLANNGPVAESRRTREINRPHVWANLANTSLVDLQFRDQPRKSLEVLMLKGENLAEILLDALGNDKVGQLLGELRNRHVGDAYTVDEFERTAQDLQLDIDEVIGDWLFEHKLPGFRVYEPNLVRLPEDNIGRSVYQTAFYLSNESPVDGSVRIAYYELRNSERASRTVLPPARINGNSTVQVAMQTENPVYEVQIRPYLSLNQTDITLRFGYGDSLESKASDPLPFMTVVDWRPPADRSIIVDDLDDGFSVTNHVGSYAPKIRGANIRSLRDYWRTLNYFSAFDQMEYDQDLPTRQSLALLYEAQFVRSSRSYAWGRYRLTFAYAPADAVTSTAHFRTRIPQKGEWTLEYYYPWISSSSRSRFDGAVATNGVEGRPQRSFLLTVSVDDSTIPMEVDVSKLSRGWNQIGTYELGETAVELTLQPTGTAPVYADAIRWTPTN